MKQRFIHISLISLWLFLSFSCQSEIPVSDSLPEETEAGLYFLMNLNESGGADTRTTGDALDVSSFQDTYAFYFKKNAGEYIYEAHESLGSPATTAKGNKAFRLNNCPKNATIQILFVANAFANDLTNGTYSGKKIDEVLNMLVLKNAKGVAVWATDSPVSTPTKYIPQFAQTKDLQIPASINDVLFIRDNSAPVKEDNVPAPTSYELVRSVAKFTINNYYSAPASGKTKAKIKELYVINGNDKGYAYHNTLNSVNIPTGITKSQKNVTNKIGEVALDTGTQTYTFYLFEAANTDPDRNSTSNCYIRLELELNDNTSDIRSYMLHIPKSGAVDDVGNVIRNHHYTYDIKGVIDYKTLVVDVNVVDWEKARIPVDLE